ncbi:hypothetical protein M3Y97_00103300 [Aphelenchoides bicaudatus]|nr:hypothetical protein M3Y97_00103300 [Aphelenchoides bicaudatus]
MGNCQTQSPSRKDPVFFNQAAAGENAAQPTGDAIPPEQVASTSDEEVLKASVQENKPSDTKENEAAETGLHHNLAGKLIKASEVSRLIDEQLIKDYRANERIVKLLLLGPSESGKSTVLKQMKLTHCHGQFYNV